MNAPAKTAITIGNFDALHLGHRELIRRARAAVGEQGTVVLLTFDPHPAEALGRGPGPARLTTLEQRIRIAKSLGADVVEPLIPTTDLLSLSPDLFIESLVARYQPSHIVEGHDFCFGANRSGDLDTLRMLGACHGFELIEVDPVEVALSDQSIVHASSSITRWLLDQGRVDDAARVLGRPYAITGAVVRGDQRGRTIGFPTANLKTDQLIPRDGVYAGIAHTPDGAAHRAAIHIGPRKTFDALARTVEVHIIGWQGELPISDEDYGWPIRAELTGFLRDPVKFAGIDELVAQIQRDVHRASTFGSPSTTPAGATA